MKKGKKGKEEPMCWGNDPNGRGGAASRAPKQAQGQKTGGPAWGHRTRGAATTAATTTTAAATSSASSSSSSPALPQLLPPDDPNPLQRAMEARQGCVALTCCYAAAVPHCYCCTAGPGHRDAQPEQLAATTKKQQNQSTMSHPPASSRGAPAKTTPQSPTDGTSGNSQDRCSARPSGPPKEQTECQTPIHTSDAEFRKRLTD